MRSDTSLECRIEVCRQIRSEDHNTVEGLQFAKEHVHSQVHLTVIRQSASCGTACRDGIRFIEKEHRILLGSRTEYAGDVFRSLADPHRLCFRVIHYDKIHAAGVRDTVATN